MKDIVEYKDIFSHLKNKIVVAQQRAVVSINKELVLLYWEIGNTIINNQSQKGWGAKIIDTLSEDLNKEFPQMRGFSVRNLKYMRQFAQTYPKREFVQEVLAQLSWYNNITIIQKVKDEQVRK